MPYGRFTYRVVGHRVVSADDWSIIRPRRYPALVLSACHPLFSASHRWVVFARLTSVRTPDGGYGKTTGATSGSTYHTFLVGLCYQLLSRLAGVDVAGELVLR